MKKINHYHFLRRTRNLIFDTLQNEFYFGVCAVCSLINVVRPVGSRKSSTSTRTDGNNLALYK